MRMTINQDGAVFLAACMCVSGIVGFGLGYHAGSSDAKCPSVENAKVIRSSYNRYTGDDSCIYAMSYAKATFRKEGQRK